MRKFVGVAALFLAILGIDACFGLNDAPRIVLRLLPITGSLTVHPVVAVGLGVITGAALVVCTVAFVPKVENTGSSTTPGGSPGWEWMVLGTGVVIAATGGLLLIAAVSHGKIGPVAAALAYLLGWLAALATIEVIRRLRGGEGVSFDSYWGGLGGAQGGWRLSPSTTLLLLALVLVAGTVGVATGSGPRGGAAAENKQAASEDDGAGENETNQAANNPADTNEAAAVGNAGGGNSQ